MGGIWDDVKRGGAKKQKGRDGKSRCSPTVCPDSESDAPLTAAPPRPRRVSGVPEIVQGRRKNAQPN